MRKMSKKLYVALAAFLCISIAFAVCATHSDADEHVQEKTQRIPTKTSQEKGESKEERYTANQIAGKGAEVNEKEGDHQEERGYKTAVVSNSMKEKTESKPTQEVSKHTHSWEPVRSVRTDYETVDIYGLRCNNCGYVTIVADDLYNHIDKDPFDRCGSYSTGVVINTEQKPIKTEYVSGYKCSCGAEK